MEQDSIRIVRFIAVKLMEKVVLRMFWISYLIQFFFEDFYLIFVKELDAAEVSLLMKKINLFLAEPVRFPLFKGFWIRE